MFCSFLQGGGVYVYSGTVTMTSCTITGNSFSNTASGPVRAHVQNFPSPDGKMAHVLAPTHACTTANASVNYRGYVPHRDLEKVPNAPMGCLPFVSSFEISRLLLPTHRGPISLSMKALSAPGQRPSPASLEQSQLAQHPCLLRRPHCRLSRPHRLCHLSRPHCHPHRLRPRPHRRRPRHRPRRRR